MLILRLVFAAVDHGVRCCQALGTKHGKWQPVFDSSARILPATPRLGIQFFLFKQNYHAEQSAKVSTSAEYLGSVKIKSCPNAERLKSPFPPIIDRLFIEMALETPHLL